MSTCIGGRGFSLRSVLVQIQKRRVGGPNCVKAVGSGDNSNATVTRLEPSLRFRGRRDVF